MGLAAEKETLAPYKRGRKLGQVAATKLLKDSAVQDYRVRSRSSVVAQGLESRYLDQHPEVVSIQKQIDSLTRATRSEIKNIARSVEREFKGPIRRDPPRGGAWEGEGRGESLASVQRSMAPWSKREPAAVRDAQ